jgi:hypothetical protein
MIRVFVDRVKLEHRCEDYENDDVYVAMGTKRGHKEACNS